MMRTQVFCDKEQGHSHHMVEVGALSVFCFNQIRLNGFLVTTKSAIFF